RATLGEAAAPESHSHEPRLARADGERSHGRRLHGNRLRREAGRQRPYAGKASAGRPSRRGDLRVLADSSLIVLDCGGMVEREDVHAAIEARRELGAELEPHIIDSFVERIEKRLRETRALPAKSHRREGSFMLALA